MPDRDSPPLAGVTVLEVGAFAQLADQCATVLEIEQPARATGQLGLGHDGVAAALRDRGRTGLGQYVAVSLLEPGTREREDPA